MMKLLNPVLFYLLIFSAFSSFSGILMMYLLYFDITSAILTSVISNNLLLYHEHLYSRMNFSFCQNYHSAQPCLSSDICEESSDLFDFLSIIGFKKTTTAPRFIINPITTKEAANDPV